MKYFIDFEFLEDGRTITPISVGLAAADGRTYYAEFAGFDRSLAYAGDGWLAANVLPLLSGKVQTAAEIAGDIREFVGVSPEFWGYYASYDWVCLAQLYGRMIDLPPDWPKWCRDVMQLRASLGDPVLPKQGSAEHHALNDAVWTMQSYWFLDELDRKKYAKRPAVSVGRDP